MSHTSAIGVLLWRVFCPPRNSSNQPILPCGIRAILLFLSVKDLLLSMRILAHQESSTRLNFLG